ncbi:MAG: hypothetical protein U0359_30715 [Byssovorax sp.]
MKRARGPVGTARGLAAAAGLLALDALLGAAGVACAPRAEEQAAALSAGDPRLRDMAREIAARGDQAATKAARARLLALARGARADEAQLRPILEAMRELGGTEVVWLCVQLAEDERLPVSARALALSVLDRDAAGLSPALDARRAAIVVRLAHPDVHVDEGPPPKTNIEAAAYLGGYARCAVEGLMGGAAVAGSGQIVLKVEDDVVIDARWEGPQPASYARCVEDSVRARRLVLPEGGNTVVLKVQID